LDSDNYTLSGVITGDSVTIANTSGSYADKNAGTSKTVTVTDLTLSGDDASNYTIASNSVSGNVGVIDQAALTITANNVTNTLGDANPNFSATYSALVMGDTIASLDGTLTFSTTATTSSEAGSYVITASGLSSDNYAITYVNGVLTVTDSSNETTWRTEPYNGAVIHADQTSFQGAASKNSGRFSGNAPVTIVDSGINISGYAPLSEQDLPKKPVLEKDKISIEVVNFNTDQDTIPPQNYPILDEVVEMASQHPLWNFRLIGHTDNIGSDENNLDLSWHRAIAVKNYLVSKDVSENRLIIEAKGKSQPLASNETDDDRAKNRRVEIRVK
ncbi:MAG: OmpA family protein, partial [Firmicutes bacterium]|nr:OmpA family protein [Bacillota bacterium]